jgi:hypothetical protein
MSCIVGLNDAADEKNKWVRVLKDVEEVCVRPAGQRRSHAAAVIRNRANNDVEGVDASEGPLLGREGLQEQQTMRKIRRIQKVARGTAESDRQAEAAMFKSDLRSSLCLRKMIHCQCLNQQRGQCRFLIYFLGAMAYHF